MSTRSIDPETLLAILHAAKSANLEKLLDDVKKADKEVEDANAKLATAKQKLSEGVPPELASLLKPSKAGASKKGRSSKSGDPKADVADAKELKTLLNKAPDKKLDRKGLNALGYKLKSAKDIAKAEPKTFGVEESGAQGSVWLK